MSSSKYKFAITISAFVAVILSLGCFFKITAQETVSGPTPRNTNKVKLNTGIVTGKVLFGPLRPGPVRIDEPADSEERKQILQRMYSKYRVNVLSDDGKKTIGEAAIDKDGVYRLELSPGKYKLQITPAPGRLQKEPVEVEVKAGKTVTADINVDTGIR